MLCQSEWIICLIHCERVSFVFLFQCGTRHIIETMENSGHSIKLLVCCGGLSKNKLYVQTHADVAGELVQPALHVTCLVFDIRKKKFLCVCPSAGLPILLPDVTESVLLGTAILGACASGEFATIQVCVTRGEKS